MGTLILLSIANWLHLLATVIWIGGMVIFSLVIIPGASVALGPGPMFGKLMETLAGKYKPLAYISIVILIVSGILMFLLNENYEGLGNISRPWAKVMLVKHILVAVMVIIGIYAGEVVARKIGKLTASGGASKAPQVPVPELAKLLRLQLNLARLNLVLGVIVLLLTGIVTAISAT